jgi:hypothetical protein
MSYQAVLGVGPQCYVSTVLFKYIFCLLELNTAHTGQSCLFNWLFNEDDGGSSNPYTVFCNFALSAGDDFLSQTGCSSSGNVTICAIDGTSK